MKNDNAGVSFLELILVVALVSIISIMSPIFYSRFILQNAVFNTADQLSGSLRKAQLYSMMSKQGSAWSVNYSSNAITLYKGTTFSGHDTSFDEKFDVNSNVSVSGITDISFARITGISQPSTSTINISSNNNSKTITVNSQGVASRQ